MEKVRVGRPAKENPRSKKFSLLVPDEDWERAKSLVVKYDVIYYDIIEKGIEYWENLDSISDFRLLRNGYLTEKKTRRISVRVSEDELQRMKDVTLKYNIKYYDIFIKGIECWENL